MSFLKYAAVTMVLASPAAAATLDFAGDICNGGGACGNNSPIDQTYGDIAGEVDIQWDANRATAALENVLHWAGNYETLDNVAYALDSGSGMSILMSAAAGFDVTLGGFDLARYDDRERDTSVQVIDLASGLSIFDSGVFSTTLDGVYNFAFNATSSAGFEILFGPDAWNVGISNIEYATSVTPDAMSPVPLPAAGWMLFAGLGGLAAMRRKRG